MYKTKKNYLLSILTAIFMVLLISLMLSSCGKGRPKDNDAQKNSFRGKKRGEGYVYSVSAKTIYPSSIQDIITIGGSVQAKKSASITPDTNGTLTSILVYEGQKVKKGEILAYVDPSKAGKNFNLSPVKSSITGVVASLPTYVGNSVTTQQVIANVVDDSEIELKLSIPEKYVGKITDETKGHLTLIAFPGEKFPMKIKSRSTVLSSSTHTMPVTMEFITPDARIKSGMYGSIHLTLLDRNNTFVIRRDAIVIRLIQNVAKKGVYLIRDIDAEPKSVYFSEIEVGIEDSHNVEIISGLKEGDVMITQGQESLAEDSLVNIFYLDGETLITPEEQIERDRNATNAESQKKRPPKENAPSDNDSKSKKE